jgi:NodT family efflux transporter outer membrane factor (OMF) lipoprotein
MITVRSWAILGMSCALNACTVGPDYQKPTLEMPAKWTLESPWRVSTPKDDAPKGAWWLKFNDAQLNELQEKAIANNPTLAVATGRWELARSALNAATAALYPQMSANIAETRARISSQRALTQNDKPLYTTTQSETKPVLGVSYEADISGRVKRTLELSAASSEQVRADLENIRLLVSADLATAYFNLRAVDIEIDVLSRSIALQRRALDLANARHDLGATSGIEVSQQQALIDSTLTQVDILKRQRGQFEHAIATLIGTPAPSFSLPAMVTLLNPPKVSIGVPSDLLERRPDVAGAERAMAAANAQVGISTAAYYPSFTLTSTYGSQSRDDSTLFSGPAFIWSIGSSLVQPIFDGGRIAANIKSSKISYDMAVSSYRRVVLTAMQEVEDGITGMTALERAHTQATAATASAQKVLNLANARYEGGVASYLEVITAQQALLVSQRLVAQLVGQRLLNAVFLIKALGGDFEGMSQARTEANTPSEQQTAKEPALRLVSQ